MFKFFVLAALVAVSQAYGYGGGASYGGGSYSSGPISLAVRSNHQIRYIDVPTYSRIQPITIEVGAQPIPINFLMRSASSQLNVQQAHQAAQGSFYESNSQDEPHILKHYVTKPIIQEIRELITPYRRITQEVQPVQEDIQTIVARAQAYGGGYGGGAALLGGSRGGY